MRSSGLALWIIVGLGLLSPQAGGQAHSVEVQAVLGNTVVLLIDGQRQNLKVGETDPAHGGHPRDQWSR